MNRPKATSSFLLTLRNFVKEKILFIYLLEIMRSGGLFNTFAGSLNPTKYRELYKKDMNDN